MSFLPAMGLYELISRQLMTRLSWDPEVVSNRVLSTLAWLNEHQTQSPYSWLMHGLRAQLEWQDPKLTQTLQGLTFPNPVGLAAGFDKNGVATSLWSSLGFGFAEVGTVTAQAQPGNPRPRLFRLDQDQAALNRMGFNNEGAAAMAERLRHSHLGQTSRIPIGINLGKSKVTPLEDAPADYLTSFQHLKELGDYFVVNVSSPNTPGLRTLQTTEALTGIIYPLLQANTLSKPIFVKIAPDLSWDDVVAVVDAVDSLHLAGIIATNTTLSRESLMTERLDVTGNLLTDEPGGISGHPLRHRSTEIIRFIHQQTQGRILIIGVGGIFSAADAWEKIVAGASLVQVYTGWIYKGPQLVRGILQGLGHRVRASQLTSIAEAVGRDDLAHLR